MILVRNKSTRKMFICMKNRMKCMRKRKTTQKKIEYEDLYEVQKVKVHNDYQNTSSNEHIQVEEPVINVFEELVDPDGNKNELQVKHEVKHRSISPNVP